MRARGTYRLGVAALAIALAATSLAVARSSDRGKVAATALSPLVESTPVPSSSRAAPTPSPTPTSEPARSLSEVYVAHGLDVPSSSVERAGCPPPPPDGGGPGGGGDTPWRPAITIPEEALPAAPDPAPWTTSAEAATGKGMWIWQYSKTEDEDYQRIVDRAVEAGLDHLWVRVGDSRYRFYAEERLNTLVPLAHAAGLDVIGWGFPFLHDPVDDVDWSIEAIEWRSPDGRGLDAFSPDIEMATEGVEMTPRRIELYLALLRAQAGDRPLFATVYPPVDWVMETDYPYETMARYVDAFVPMDYWMCGEPGYLVRQSLDRLAHLRPVHVIGQAFHNHGAGRRVPPDRHETLRFFDVAAREGAVGASLWVWQDIDADQWDAMAAYPWWEAVRAHEVSEPADETVPSP